ncbi:unnamed protein product [Auanema sp. JU1783]|nr:unnamed protein product [Auanema sp. JU1783]
MALYGERLAIERQHRVLSIQSHVVHGYAGNKCSVFPLQLNGYEVDFINSVQFSNHAGYEHVKGQKLSSNDLEDLYEGLQLNKINNYSHILTGYCGNVDFLRKIGDIVSDLKKKDGSTLFFCDPVMGDNGRYYTPRELLPVYRDVIIPLADVLTPNAFELGELTGSVIETEEECFRGMDVMHSKGVKTVVVTSGVTKTQTENSLACFASVSENGQKKRYRFQFPRLVGQFVGTGDVFASLLIVHLTECEGDVAQAVGKTLGSMQGLLRKTSEYAQLQVDSNSSALSELRLIQARKELLLPPQIITAENVAL